MAILVAGQPQKELANGTVTLPFGSEYSLRLRNKNSRRAVAKVHLDGENVGGYVIEANDYVDIHRPADVDKAFKFVSLDSPDAVDFGKNGPNLDKQKGLVEVHFYLEKEVVKPPVEHHHHHHHDHWRPYPAFPLPSYPYRKYGDPIWFDNTRSCSMGGAESTTSNMSSNSMSSDGDISRFKRISTPRSKATLSSFAPSMKITDKDLSFTSSEKLNDGCTVQGGTTNQRFRTVTVDTEETCTVIKVFLQGWQPEPEVVAEPRKTNKVQQLETENEELRRKLAELENEKLKDELKKKTKAKKITKNS